MKGESTQKAIERYFAALSRNDAKAAAACFAADGVCRNPADSPPQKGPQAIAASLEVTLELFSVLTITAKSVHVSEQQGIAVFWEADGIGSNGRKMWFDGIDIIHLNADGLFASLMGYWEPATVLSTLKQPPRAMHKGSL